MPIKRLSVDHIADAINLAPPVAFSSVSSFVLQAPPYNFSAGLVGLLGVPGLSKSDVFKSSQEPGVLTMTVVGNLAGAIGGGILTDIWAQRQARRNNGIFEPETRLTLLLFPAAADIVGLLMIGFGLEKKLSWVVIYVGFAFLSVGLTGVANIGMTYVMDSYFPIAAECLLLVNGLKNVFAFGFAYAAIPWAESQGYARVGNRSHTISLKLTIRIVLRGFAWHICCYPPTCGASMEPRG